MKKFTLLGQNISKSLSPLLHTTISQVLGHNTIYTLTDIEENQLQSTVNKLLDNFDGFNITAPFKISVAKMLGSVLSSINTVVTKPLNCFSTDGIGVINSLKHFGIDISNSNVLIIGGGGSSISVIESLKECGANISLYNRTYEKAVLLCNKYLLNNVTKISGSYDIVCSMIPMPVNTLLDKVSTKVVINSDYNYQINKSDCIYIDGKYMLYYQGVRAYELFNSVSIDSKTQDEILKIFLQRC